MEENHQQLKNEKQRSSHYEKDLDHLEARLLEVTSDNTYLMQEIRSLAKEKNDLKEDFEKIKRNYEKVLQSVHRPHALLGRKMPTNTISLSEDMSNMLSPDCN